MGTRFNDWPRNPLRSQCTLAAIGNLPQKIAKTAKVTFPNFFVPSRTAVELSGSLTSNMVRSLRDGHA